MSSTKDLIDSFSEKKKNLTGNSKIEIDGNRKSIKKIIAQSRSSKNTLEKDEWDSPTNDSNLRAQIRKEAGLSARKTKGMLPALK